MTNLPEPLENCGSYDSRIFRVTAAIPAFNEEEHIEEVVDLALRYADEVIVVDDGSTDLTGVIAARKGARVLRHESNLGYGAALASGLKLARREGVDILVTLDADGQHDPSEIPLLIKPIVEGTADIVTGSRFITSQFGNGMPIYRRFGIGVVNRAWNAASRGALTDTQCGFRAYSKRATSEIDITQANMSASLEILDRAAKRGLRIAEVPVNVKYGKKRSKTEPGRHGLVLVNYILKRIREERPLLIIGGIGVALVALGVVSAAWSLSCYFSAGSLPFGPTVLTAVFLSIGALMFFSGLILDSIQKLGKSMSYRD